MRKFIRDVLMETPLVDVAHALRPHHFTVLAYHRIVDLHMPGFDTFIPNVSATPTAFAEQLDFIQRRFNVIALDDLLNWLAGEGELPRFPLLITFDDGYRDNLEHAVPLLHERNMPAVLFVTTGHIGRTEPFWWDLVAYCFHHTTQDNVQLPVLGHRTWQTTTDKTQIMRTFLAALKQVPEDDKRAVVSQLPDLLSVVVPDDYFASLFLSWDDVRTMMNYRVAIGAHTITHPIMTRIPLAHARREATESRARLEAEIGSPVTTFAYTNGLESDFNDDIQQMLRDEGFVAAFTLISGLNARESIQRNPMTIRRIAISHKDTLPRFAVKLLGKH